MVEAIRSSGEAAAGFTWRKLLVLAAVADLIILTIMVVAFGDLLALVLAVAIAIGLALTRFRGGVLGTVLLGLAMVNLCVKFP